MKIIQGSKKLTKKLTHVVLTLGNFDGVHKGHKKILKKTIDIANKKNGTSILYTFEPHPVKILAPDLAPQLLQTQRQKIEALEHLGLDILIIEPFTKDLAALNTSDFFEKIILQKVAAKEIVIGYDFTFGQHRAGKVDDLAKLAKKHKIKCHVVDALLHKESLLSSTHIRHFVTEGNIKMANAMLGRPYSIEGVVIKGRGVGAELGFHTANLSSNNELNPPTGVYITKTKIKKTGKTYKSVTNIGYNPTFKGTKLCIETYLLNFSGNLLKKALEIFFYKKIRREITFETIEALRDQISKDVSQTRKFYEKRV